jgi:hypothetical protein
MLIRLPINLSHWGSNVDSYSKLTVHPLLSVIVNDDMNAIKLSGMPYVTVRVLLESSDLVVETPFIDFDHTDWFTYKSFTVSGSGILRFRDDEEIIIPSSITLRTFVTVVGDQLVVAGDRVYIV